MSHPINITFLFLLGACVGSFLNVVVWRLPRDESLSDPPSHCPKCNRRLKWYDNIPIVGWIKLRGRCRFCQATISPRYPIIEAATALLFVFFYTMFFIFQHGPCVHPELAPGLPPAVRRPLLITQDWPIFALDLFLICALLAASLIDAELFIIPITILWSWKGGVVWVALLVHTVFDKPGEPGALNTGPLGGAIALGGAMGLIVSIFLVRSGHFPLSFAEGAPLLEIERQAAEEEKRKKEQEEKGTRRGSAVVAVQEAAAREYSPAEVRAEIRKEMLFLLPPLALAMAWALLTWRLNPLARHWQTMMHIRWLSALLGSVLGGLVGGFVVWLTRILGSIGFGREAMGMGDVDLMAGVGAVIGAGAATIAFFLAPFFGIAIAIYMLLTGTRRELPYGPYLSLASAFVMLFYCPIANYLAPGIIVLADLLRQLAVGN